jgi:phenylacetate-CoA ligase
MNSFLIKYFFDPFWAMKDMSPRWLYAQYLESTQYYSLERLVDIQKKRLHSILLYAARTVPYYEELFKKNKIDLEERATGKVLLKQIPFLTKEIIKRNSNSLISKRYEKAKLECAKTGGSTGESLTLYLDFICNQKRNATAQRSDRWSGWDVGMPIGAIWGNPPKIDSFKKRLRNTLLQKMFYLDTMALTKESMTAFALKIKSETACAIFGHAHSIYIFAEFCRASSFTDLRPKGIISTSMMLLTNERLIIEDVFKTKVTNRYGCEEVSLIGCECEEHNGMHLNIEHLFIECIKPDGGDAAPGEEGEIVVTDLMNYGMPFIRYRLGDMGVLSDRKCPCGRAFPMLERVTGRTADFLKKKDGTLVAGISLIERTLTKIPGLKQMQIVQQKIDLIQINCVWEEMVRMGADSGSKEKMRQSEILLLNEFKQVFQGATIDINFVDSLQQEANGKYRFSICKI